MEGEDIVRKLSSNMCASFPLTHFRSDFKLPAECDFLCQVFDKNNNSLHHFLGGGGGGFQGPPYETIVDHMPMFQCAVSGYTFVFSIGMIKP